MKPPALSVVIPTLNEELALADLLGDLRSLTVPREIIVADGGSTDGTPAVAAARGATLISTSRGRGKQLRAGARAASAQALCFLHADVRLDPPAFRALESLVEAGVHAAYAFQFRIDAPGARYRFIEFGANRRSRWGKLPYGDQGLIVSRAAYDRAGGFPDIPIMEDVALIRALARYVPIRVLPAPVRISPRRWQRDGPLTRMLSNWALMTAYLAGMSPERIAKIYNGREQAVDSRQ